MARKINMLACTVLLGSLCLSACSSQPDSLPTSMGEVSTDAPHVASSDQVNKVKILSDVDIESRELAKDLFKAMEQNLIDTEVDNGDNKKAVLELVEKHKQGEEFLKKNVEVPEGFEWKYEGDTKSFKYTIKVWNPEGDVYKDESTAVTEATPDRSSK